MKSSRRFSLYLAFLLPLTLGACTEDPDTTAARSRRAAEGYSAVFPAYPADLFAAFQQFCTGPAKNYNRYSRDSVQCSEYLPPEQTAKVILRYNGVVSDLPKLVIHMTGTPANGGYTATTRNYLTVPQSDGSTLRVVFAFQPIEHQLDALFRMAGGTPL